MPPNPNTILKDERIIQDKKIFMDICNRCDANISEENVEEIIRLGKKGEEPRPMLIKMNNSEDKRVLFRNLCKLKEDNSPYSRISVNHDMTKQEREENKKLISEAKELQDNDESGNWIFKVRGPPWDRKIRKIKVNQNQ